MGTKGQGLLYEINVPASMIGYDLPHDLVADRRLSSNAKLLFAIGVSFQRRLAPEASFDVKKEVAIDVLGLSESEFEQACTELQEANLYRK